MTRLVITPRPCACDDAPIVQPPSSVTVDFGRRVSLYLPNGRVLVRVAGFSSEPIKVCEST